MYILLKYLFIPRAYHCIIHVVGQEQCGVRNQLLFEDFPYYGFGPSPYASGDGFNRHHKSSDFGRHPWQVRYSYCKFSCSISIVDFVQSPMFVGLDGVVHL